MCYELRGYISQIMTFYESNKLTLTEMSPAMLFYKLRVYTNGNVTDHDALQTESQALRDGQRGQAHVRSLSGRHAW